jgi:hypothetical protein
MAFVNRPIPNLYQGVSQQAAALRLPTQCELQENAYSSIVEGLKKRPPTNHLAKLLDVDASEAYVHVMNRDSSERYILIITNGDLKVFDFYGAAMTVNFPNGKGYLSSSYPQYGFSAITVADYTFIVNKDSKVAMTGATSGGSVKGSKQRFTDLPTSGNATNDIWEVSGDSNNDFDSYYVRWDGAVWRETIKPGLSTNIDGGTMPHQLVRNSDGTFTFQQVSWEPRIVGNDKRNPLPSFVGRYINDVFFHRNRLGFCADENVIFSRAGEFFNFFVETATNILDSDPIDVSVNHTKVSIIRHAVPFNTSLMLFSDQVQFQLSARDLLTPKTVNINAVTEFEINPDCPPIGIGQDLYFAVNRGNYTGIREYFVQPLTYTNDASDITSHVPKYVPGDVYRIIGSSSEDILFTLNGINRNEMHVYKFYWGADDQKIQSSWSVWKFDENDKILNGACINNYLYLVIQRTDGVYLEVINIQAGIIDNDMGVLVHLDRKKKLTGTYNSATNKTTWTLPYPEANVQGVLGGGFGYQAGVVLTLSRPSSTTATANGDYSGLQVYFGRPYTMRYRFSEIFFRDNSDKSVVSHYQLMLKNLEVLYNNTGYLRMEVTPKNRDTYKYVFTGQEVGVTELGSIPVASGSLKAPVYSDTKGLTIDLINDSYLPCYLQAAEWEAVLSTLSRRLP